MIKYTFSKFLTIILLAIFATASFTKAQDLDETLANLSSIAGQKYVAPVINAFGSNLNTGWVSKVPTKFVGFSAELKFIGVGTVLDEADERFTASGNFNFTDAQADEILRNSFDDYDNNKNNYAPIKEEILRDEGWDVSFDGPTITGSEDENLVVTFPGIQDKEVKQYPVDITEVKGFLNQLSMFPSAAVQLTVGTVLGTNVAIRYLPSIEIKDLGKFNWIGFGFIHNPGIWLANPLPVDLALGYFFQKLDVGDVFESNATQFGIFASKTIGIITPYASLTTETSETKIKYDYQFDLPGGLKRTQKIEFDLEGENKTSFTLGLSLQLAVVNINADYKFGKVKTLSGGLSFGF